MKFETYPLSTNSHGFQFAKNHIIKTSQSQGCMHCGQPTTFIDVISEGYLCSDKCEAGWYSYLDWATQAPTHEATND